MYNLPGTDSKHEWIEILNNSDSEINLAGWKFSDGSNHVLNEPPKNGGQGLFVIPSGGYAILADNATTFLSDYPEFSGTVIDTVMSLKNASAVLKFFDSEDNEIDSVAYENSWGGNGNGKTLEKIDAQGENTQSNWQESADNGGTPGAANSSGAEAPVEDNQPEDADLADFKPATDYPPVADAGPDIIAVTGQEIFFDGSLSADPDWDDLIYFWNFGDGNTSAEKNPSHVYNFPGQYITSLAVEDNKFTAIDTAIINVYSSTVVISEFLPDQWIELQNQSSYIANLSGWRLNNFIFPDNTLIAPSQFLVLTQPDCSGALQLFYPDGSLVSQIAYSEDRPAGAGVVFDGDSYYWSKIPTPGLANIVSSVELTGKSSGASPITTKEVQAMPEGRDKTILSQNNLYSVNNLSAESSVENERDQLNSTAPKTNILSEQSVNISQNAMSEQKAKMILVLSIVISSSLMVAWIMLLIKKKLA